MITITLHVNYSLRAFLNFYRFIVYMHPMEMSFISKNQHTIFVNASNMVTYIIEQATPVHKIYNPTTECVTV